MLKTKVGYSVDVDSFTSGKETATKAMEGYINPKAALLYGSCKYNSDELLKGAKSVIGTLPIIGCTSSGSLIVSEGIITSENGFSGMMILDDEDTKVVTSGMERGNDPRETGRNIAVEAIKKAGSKIRPSYFYMVASPAEEEQYLKGIQDVIGRVPFFGGSCADDTVNAEWKIYCDDKTFTDGCAVLFIYTNKKIVTEYTGAYEETSDRGIITKLDGKRTLAEIDGIPALQRYAEWTGTTVDKLQGMDLLSASILSPLGIKDPLGDLTLIRHPMVGNEDNTMNVGNNLEIGTAIIRMETTVEGLIKSTKDTLEKANKSLDVKPGGYFLVHCGGRKLGIKDRMEEVYQNLKEVAGDIPFMTIFTFGEYGYTNHSANSCGGLMLSFTAFGE